MLLCKCSMLLFRCMEFFRTCVNLGKVCHRLRRLELESCENITDAGIQAIGQVVQKFLSYAYCVMKTNLNILFWVTFTVW